MKFVMNIMYSTKNFAHFLQLNDAYEEVDEQRQVVAQWKRKTQKVTGKDKYFPIIF